MPIDQARLSAIKSHLRYEFAGSLDSADAVAGAVGEAIAVTGTPESINDLFDAYDRLTPSDLQRVAGRYFQPSNETAVILENGGQEMSNREHCIGAIKRRLLLLAPGLGSGA